MSSYRTIGVGTQDIFYREAGDPDAPALLLLEGFPSSSAQYEQLIGHLSDRWYLIAPDYPGFGRSPSLEGETTFERLADAVEAFTQAIDLRRYSLYMFDFGAPVGFRLATRHPDRVQGGLTEPPLFGQTLA